MEPYRVAVFCSNQGGTAKYFVPESEKFGLRDFLIPRALRRKEKDYETNQNHRHDTYKRGQQV